MDNKIRIYYDISIIAGNGRLREGPISSLISLDRLKNGSFIQDPEVVQLTGATYQHLNRAGSRDKTVRFEVNNFRT